MAEGRQGLIHVYTGEGKGKTTAALGLALRAVGHGWHIYVGQFMKGQDYGELAAAALLGDQLTIEQFGLPTFIHVGRATPQDIRMAKEGLAAARQALESSHYDMVILDEINVALYFELLAVQEVIEVIDARPPQVELVLTGRRVPDEILARADYITEMREVRHPYQRGIHAREGIEF
jgi:cob(I)alamin adenosyltransferase